MGKAKGEDAVSIIGDYENALIAAAKRHDVDGIICGHIHHAAIHDRLGIQYINCGDWVESCTAVGETFDGQFEIIRWADEKIRQRIAGKTRSDPAAACEPENSHPLPV